MSFEKQTQLLLMHYFLKLMKTGLDNVLLPTLFMYYTRDPGSTMLFNTVNSLEQCWQKNIVQSCYHQSGTTRSSSLIFAYVSGVWPPYLLRNV